MPEVPLFRGGEAVRTAGPGMPVLDTERRPRVDYGGLLSGIGQVVQSAKGLARAMEPVLIDPDAFAGKGRGLQMLGRGLQDVGSVFGEIAQRKALTKNYADLSEAENQMNMAQAEFEKWKLQNMANPDSWEGEWKSRLGTLQKQFEANKSLSPAARDRLKMAFGDYATTSSGRVMLDSARATFNRADAASQAKYRTYVDAGDLPRAQEAKAERNIMGFETPEESAYDLQVAQREIEDKKVTEWAEQNPTIALEQASLPPDQRQTDVLNGLSDAQLSKVVNNATTSLFTQKRQLIARAAQEIGAGKIKDETQLHEWVNRYDPGVILDEGDFGHLRGEISKTNPKNLPEAWTEGYRAIHSLDTNAPEDERRMKEAQLRTWFDQAFDGPMQSEMNQILDDRLADVEGIASADMKEAAELIENETKRGAFGSYMKQKTDAQGRPLAEVKKENVIHETKGMWWWKRPGTPEDAEKVETATWAFEVDPDKKAKAEAAGRDALRSLEKWRKEQAASGKTPTREELFNKLNELTKGSITAGDAEAFLNGTTGPQGNMMQFLGVPAPDAAKKLKEGLK